LPLCREACWLYAIPPRLRATHRRAAHATVSRVPAAAGHTQAISEATNDACPGALREAEQVLRRKLRFVVAGHCHYAPAIRGHTGDVYGSKRKCSGLSCPPATRSDSAKEA